MSGAMKKLLVAAAALWLSTGGSAFAQTPAATRYLLRVTKESALSKVLKTYGLTEVKNIAWLVNLHVVTGPASVPPDTLVARVVADNNVRTFEPDYVASTGDVASFQPDLQQTSQSLTDALAVDRTASDFYGSPAWTGYVRQPAFTLMDVEKARAEGRTGGGVIIAVIDSGIDPYDQRLAGVLLPGYDFTRNQPGASEWLDIDPATATTLQSDACGTLGQSTAAIMDGYGTPVLMQSTAAIMDSCSAAIVTQSTAAIMDAGSVEQLAALPPLPTDFGHGTMVAGLIHAVAPGARILPIKAFRAGGTGNSSDIAQAIYYAWLMGARVINMSFTFSSKSQEVMYATAYAALGGLVEVGAAGNQGLVAQRWPAEHKWVIGVGSTTLGDARSTFSNHGYDTFKVGAPGENLITTYPGNHYASVSGTSFSAALVSGAVSLMRNTAPALEWGATRDVVNQGIFASIAGVVRDSDTNQYPQRLIVPKAVDLAPILERNTVKQINHIN